MGKMPTAEGLSVTNLRYCRRFYLLYSEVVVIRPQVEGEIGDKTLVQIHPQAGGKFTNAQDSQKIPEIFCIPWGHHKLILDKVKGDVTKALFYIGQTIENGWSRSLLLNWIDTGLYERVGKSLTNFSNTIPSPSSGLAQEMTKDPYNFAFAGVTKRHNRFALLQFETSMLCCD